MAARAEAGERREAERQTQAYFVHIGSNDGVAASLCA
jgi:hypothetical protein